MSLVDALRRMRNPQNTWNTDKIEERTQQQPGMPQPDPMQPQGMESLGGGPAPSLAALQADLGGAEQMPNPEERFNPNPQTPTSPIGMDVSPLEAVLRRNKASRNKITGEGGLNGGNIQ